MQPNNTSGAPAIESSPAHGHSTVHDIFLMSDEQILEIDPHPQDVEVSTEARGTAQHLSVAPTSSSAGLRSDESQPDSSPEHGTQSTGHENRSRAGGQNQSQPAQSAQRGVPAPQEPPAWLATQMKNTWNGAEARALWDRVQNSEREAAAYREVFAQPEDARAIKALYPGGVAQAQATAERARLLDAIDSAYFGAQAGTPEHARTSRAQLAAMMLREDPAAFREMVYEGLRVLEAAEKQTSASANATNIPRLAQALRLNQPEVNVEPPFRAASLDPQSTPQSPGSQPAAPSPNVLVGAQHAAPQSGNTPASEAHLAAYTTFEKAANSELEKSVGGAIARALQQALPNIAAAERSSPGGTPHSSSSPAPLQARLSQAIREDVERALQGDRQLGTQVAQILASRRLDDATRAQVVRLINDRALQLVPGAAKRALDEWTQATLAAHRSRTTRSESAASRREVPAAAPASRDLRSATQTSAQQNASSRNTHSDPRPAGKARINYGKFSDDQILDM
jgi:hypothetical protein